MAFILKEPDPFHGFKTYSEIICPALKWYVRFPLSELNVEERLLERDGHNGAACVEVGWSRRSVPIALDNIGADFSDPPGA